MSEFSSTIELRADTSKLDRKLKGVRSSLDSVNQAVDKTQGNLNKFGRGVSGRLKKVNNTINDMRFQLLAVGTAIGSVTAKGIADFKKYEASLLQIGTLGVKNLEKVKESVNGLTKTYGTGSQESLKGYYDIISAGASEGSQAMEQLTAATKLAKAGNTDLAAAVDILTTGINVFGDNGETAESITDQLFTTVKLGKTTVEELGQSFGFVAATADAAGVSFGETGAALAVMTAGGIQTKQAVTGLKAALSNVIKVTPKAEKAAKALGIEFTQAALAEKGFVEFFREIKDKTGGSVVELGKLFDSVEAINAVATLTSDVGMVKLSNAFDQMGKSAGTVAREFDKVDKSLQSDLDRLGETVGVFSRVIGEALVPDLKDLIKTTTPVINFFTEMVKAYPGLVKLTSTIGGLALALGVLGGGPVIALAAVGLAFKKFLEHYEVFSLGGAQAFERFNKDLQRWSSKAKKQFKDVSNTINGFLEKPIRYISDAADKIIRIFYNLYDVLVGHSIVPDLVDRVSEEFEDMSSDSVSTIEQMSSFIHNRFITLERQVSATWGRIGAIIKANVKKAKGGVDALTQTIENNRAVLNRLGAMMATMSSISIPFLVFINWDQIKSGISSIASAIREGEITEALSILASGIDYYLGNFVDAISTILSGTLRVLLMDIEAFSDAFPRLFESLEDAAVSLIEQVSGSLVGSGIILMFETVFDTVQLVLSMFTGIDGESVVGSLIAGFAALKVSIFAISKAWTALGGLLSAGFASAFKQSTTRKFVSSYVSSFTVANSSILNDFGAIASVVKLKIGNMGRSFGKMLTLLSVNMTKYGIDVTKMINPDGFLGKMMWGSKGIKVLMSKMEGLFRKMKRGLLGLGKYARSFAKAGMLGALFYGASASASDFSEEGEQAGTSFGEYLLYGLETVLLMGGLPLIIGKAFKNKDAIVSAISSSKLGQIGASWGSKIASGMALSLNKIGSLLAPIGVAIKGVAMTAVLAIRSIITAALAGLWKLMLSPIGIILMALTAVVVAVAAIGYAGYSASVALMNGFSAASDFMEKDWKEKTDAVSGFFDELAFKASTIGRDVLAWAFANEVEEAINDVTTLTKGVEATAEEIAKFEKARFKWEIIDPTNVWEAFRAGMFGDKEKFTIEPEMDITAMESSLKQLYEFDKEGNLKLQGMMNDATFVKQAEAFTSLMSETNILLAARKKFIADIAKNNGKSSEDWLSSDSINALIQAEAKIKENWEKIISAEKSAHSKFWEERNKQDELAKAISEQSEKIRWMREAQEDPAKAKANFGEFNVKYLSEGLQTAIKLEKELKKASEHIIKVDLDADAAADLKKRVTDKLMKPLEESLRLDPETAKEKIQSDYDAQLDLIKGNMKALIKSHKGNEAEIQRIIKAHYDKRIQLGKKKNEDILQLETDNKNQLLSLESKYGGESVANFARRNQEIKQLDEFAKSTNELVKGSARYLKIKREIFKATAAKEEVAAAQFFEKLKTGEIDVLKTSVSSHEEKLSVAEDHLSSILSSTDYTFDEITKIEEKYAEYTKGIYRDIAEIRKKETEALSQSLTDLINQGRNLKIEMMDEGKEKEKAQVRMKYEQDVLALAKKHQKFVNDLKKGTHAENQKFIKAETALHLAEIQKNLGILQQKMTADTANITQNMDNSYWAGMGDTLAGPLKEAMTSGGNIVEALKEGALQFSQTIGKKLIDRSMKPFEGFIDSTLDSIFGGDATKPSGNALDPIYVSMSDMFGDKGQGGSVTTEGVAGAIDGVGEWIGNAMGNIGTMISGAWTSFSGLFTGLFSTQTATETAAKATETATKVTADAANTATKIAADTANTATIIGTLSAGFASVVAAIGGMSASNAVGGFFSKGGIVPKAQYLAGGGFAGGPKGTDTVPAWLTPGEMVLNRDQQNALGGSMGNTVNQTINISGNVDDRAIQQIQAVTRNVISSDNSLVANSASVGQRRGAGLNKGINSRR